MKLPNLFLILFFILAFNPGANAQLIIDEKKALQIEDDLNLSSPYFTTISFFYNLKTDNFNPEKAAKTLEMKDGEGNRSELAVKLKQILEGKGVIIRTSEIPNEPNFVDSISGPDHRFYFDRFKAPNIYLERIGDQWKFSAYTVSRIAQIHAETYPFGTDRLLDILPKIGTDEYLGLQTWQLVGLLFLIILAFVAHLVFTFVVDRVLIYLLKRLGYGYIGENYLLPVAKIISIYLIVVLLSFSARILQLPAEIWAWVIVVFNTLKPVLITVIFYKIVDVIAAYFQHLATKTESTLDDQLVPLIRKTLKALVILVGTLFILRDGLNFDIIPFLTGLSIGGVAIALAAQDTIKNFFGSIMIFIDKPFQVGDWVTSGDIDGTVEEVGFRSTRIRTFRNSVMYVPNGKIADSVVDNHGLRKYRRFFTTLTITYDTPPELIEHFVKGLREIVLAHPNTRKDYYNIFFNNLSSYSQDIMFYIFFEVPAWPDELRARHEILIQIVKLANTLGVRFAFPTQTLHMESFPEKKELTPRYPDAKVYEQLLGEFLNQQLPKNPPPTA